MLVYRRVYCCTLHMRLRHLRSKSQFHVSTNYLGRYDFRFARLYFWSHPTTWHHMVIGVETSQDSICNIIGMNGKVVFQHPFHIFPISIPVCWFSLSQIRTEMKVPGKISPNFWIYGMFSPKLTAKLKLRSMELMSLGKLESIYCTVAGRNLANLRFIVYLIIFVCRVHY